MVCDIHPCLIIALIWRGWTVILYTRLYAMCRCSKRVLVFLVSMFCAEVAVLGVIVGMSPPTTVGEFRMSSTVSLFIRSAARVQMEMELNSLLVYFDSRPPFLTKLSRIPGTNNYSPGLHICVGGDNPHRHWLAYYWTCALCVDTILLLMALYKAWAYRQCPNLMRILAWDSIIYFVV